MTKQEFDIIIGKAKIDVGNDCDRLFNIVNAALGSLCILEEYDGDAYEN